MDKESILVFGVGKLQLSIIERAQKMGLLVVGIDPCGGAECRASVDAFEVVGGQDYEGTLAVARKYNVKAIVTAATDKPLVMMARVAEALHLPFFSTETAIISTDKLRMKECFIKAGIPCAKGVTISSVEDAAGLNYPLIVKPRDNSGSRGVILCKNEDELKQAFDEAIQYTKMDSLLVEEFIEGQEYSIEALHYGGICKVIQFTEKKTTPFPYNVELGHIQPANLTDEQRLQIEQIIANIGQALNFENCPSHTELKINERGIFIIETSPRLGGDYITSTLVPLSTGINMEDALINIALKKNNSIETQLEQRAAAVCFLSLPEGSIEFINDDLKNIKNWPGVEAFEFSLLKGMKVPNISSSLDRYGQFIITAQNRSDLDDLLNKYKNEINKLIHVKI